MYKEYKALNLSQIGKDVLEFWKQNSIFEKSITSRPENNPYTFYEGPPSANGMPGIHHVMARSIKDIFCRYKTLKGYQVKRKGGWDTHGLPIELGVEKSLGITKDDIGKKISIEDYNEACRKEVMKYTDVWNDLTEKMGYWVDLNDPYITYKNEYIETLWWILKELYNKDMLYKGYTVQPYSPKSGTGLSSHELNQPGTYKMVKDTSIVAQFHLKNDQQHILIKKIFENSDEDIAILAWTTTPWTLPSNCALAVGKGIEYVKISTFNPYTYKPVSVILAKKLINKFFKEEGENLSFENYKDGDKVIPWKIKARFKGSDLIGLRYHQLMPYVTNAELERDAFRVIPADFVTTKDGTGIVHTASVFGADDFRACKENGVPSVMVTDENWKQVPLVNKQGRFVDEVTDFAGLYVKDEYYTKEEREAPGFKGTDVLISIKLKTDNKAFDVKKYEHSYPHSWRTDEPILYYPLDSWFIRTTVVKNRLIELNKTIHWKPKSTGTGRFGNWLKNLVDWNLSRSRYWGTPLPIWRAKVRKEDDELDICIGSISDIINIERKSFENDEWLYRYKSLFVDIDSFKNDLLNNEIGLKYILKDFFDEYQRKVLQKNFEINNLYDLLHLILPEDSEILLSKYATGLKEFWDSNPIDLHRPYVDNIIIRKDWFPKINGVTVNAGPFPTFYFREPDLIDVWFDSGAMPYAQWHFPFENKEQFANAYPADFIAEGVDQTRGWFFTLHAIAVMLSETSDEVKAVNKQVGNQGIAFKNVVSNGLVLDKNGNKMSKRLGNGVDPFDTIDKYGADAARWYMISNASPWDNLKFNIEGLDEVRRKFFGTLYNTYNFFALYANIDKFYYLEDEIKIKDRPEIDQWIISLLNTLTKDVDKFYTEFEPTKAARAIQNFVDEHLSNWYVRLCRRRFWKSDNSENKLAAYQTLYTCLTTIAKLMSPIAPFFSDRLFCDLNQNTEKEIFESVHLSDFPVCNRKLVNKALEKRMRLAQDISSLVLSLRKKLGINVRQPLKRILIPCLSSDFEYQVSKVEELILSETNIKRIDFITDTSGLIKKKLKLNFKSLGKKVGKDMDKVKNLLMQSSQEQIRDLELSGFTTIILPNEDLPNTTYGVILNEDVEIIAEDVPGWQVANLGKLTVALDVNISDELKQEGISREFINRIQNLRKEKGFEVTDKINVRYRTDSVAIIEAIKNNLSYICAEILAENIVFDDQLADGETFQIDGNEILISIKKYK